MSRESKALHRLYRRTGIAPAKREPFRKFVRENAAHGDSELKRLALGWLQRKGLRA